MSIQSAFLRFHEVIKLNNFDENEKLREKRDLVLNTLRERCPKKFSSFNQGSYAMHTGVKPLQGDFDMDVGIIFRGNPNIVAPHEFKGYVFQALADPMDRVEWRNPCISVYYSIKGETLYHLDLSIFLQDQSAQLFLALGKQHAPLEQRIWQQCAPMELILRVVQRFSGEDALQFRRVIRYLKRWSALHFPREGYAAPVGIGLTLAALQWFLPFRQVRSSSSGASGYDDLAAMLNLVNEISLRFGLDQRLVLKKPVVPYDDVFARMSNQQMQEFWSRLKQLSGWLEDAMKNQTMHGLQQAFGPDFC